MPLTLTSTAFEQGAEIPRKHTCDGANVPPPLVWTDVPAATRSFLLACSDPDAPSGTFLHWAAFDIPADWRSLEEGQATERQAAGFRQAINDFGKRGYSGPCPPRRDRPHRYRFRLSALSKASLPAVPSATCADVIALAEPYVLESAELIGLYRRA